MTPDQELWNGVIENAVRDILTPDIQGATMEEQCHAFEWLMDENYQQYGFRWAAAMLGFTELGVLRIRQRVTTSSTAKLPRFRRDA